jgi:hypothetical protein
MYAMMTASLYELWAIDNIPISDEVFVQTVQLFVSPFLVPVIMWTYLLHLFARELKVKDLGIADDPLLRDWLGDDDVSLEISSVNLGKANDQRTCCKPHLRKIWAWDFPWAFATFWIEGWSNLIALAKGPHACRQLHSSPYNPDSSEKGRYSLQARYHYPDRSWRYPDASWKDVNQSD